MMNILPLKLLSFSLVLSLVLFSSCNKNSNNRHNPPEEIDTAAVIVPKKAQIKKVTFYLENSASMFGYVHGGSEYIDVLTELAQKPQFAEEKTPREFNFINGGDKLEINKIGINPSILINKLNKKGYSCGDITKSNLNLMFQIALNKAKGDSISILISDGNYDVENTLKPLTALATLGKTTRTKFIQRLDTGDIQTIMIKLNSDFNGYYYPVSINKKIKINQKRPFYIWIFGESRLLNEYFPEAYINTLNGYEAMVRFLKLDKIKISYQPIVSDNPLGRFRFDNKQINKLVSARPDREGNFQFGIAADFSLLPTDNDYLQLIDNYTCSGNFKITEVKEPIKKVYEVTAFKPTHLITLFTDKNPIGNLEIKLKNVIPPWIAKTNVDIESDIQRDTYHTYGFKFLTDAISEAYNYKSKETNIATFNIEITN